MSTQLTSFDSIQPGQFGDILNIDCEHQVVKVGLLAVGYFEYWRMYPALEEIVRQDLNAIADRLAKVINVVYPGMVDSMDKAEQAGQIFARAGVDIVVVVEGTYLPDFMVMHVLEHVHKAHVILFNTQNGCNVNPTDNYQATMRNSALIGITQLSGSFTKAKKKYDVVVGEASDQRCFEQIGKHVQAQKVIRGLRKHNIGLVGHVFRGMFDLEFDKGSVRGVLGPEVISIQVDHLIELWKNVDQDSVQAKTEGLKNRFKIRSITDNDLKRSVRLGIAMEKLAVAYKLDSLCFLGQHYIEKITGAPARIGASLLLERGFLTACEGDVGGLVMMKILHELTGNIPVQLEWGQFDKQHNALFLLGHGIASPCLGSNTADITLTRAPEEWVFEGNGVNWEMIAKPGPVTLGHLLYTPGGWQMLISSGESIKFPVLPCDEIHAMVQVKSAVEDYLRKLIELGVTHHVIMVHGECNDTLKVVANTAGIRHVCVE